MSKDENYEGEIIALIRLSTGYEVPMELPDVKGKSMDHLCQAIFGEILLPRMKEVGPEKAMETITSEALDCVIRLSEDEKNILLSTLIFEFAVDKWSGIADKINQKNPPHPSV